MAFFAAYPISLDATALLIFLVLPCCPPPSRRYAGMRRASCLPDRD